MTSHQQMNCSADDSTNSSIITTASSILVSSASAMIDSSSSSKSINNISTLLIEPLITNGRNAVAGLMLLEDEESSVDIGSPPHHSFWRYNAYVSAALVVAYSLVFMAGIVGNLLVVFTVLRDSRMVPRCCVTNLFLVNLAAADLLVCMACIPFTLVAHLIYPWVLGSVICKLVPYLQGVSVAASVYTLVAVAVERHRSISFPWKRRLSSSCGRWIILFIWLFAFIITLPWLFVFNQSLSQEGFLVCTESWPSPVMGDIYFAVAHLTLCFVFPLAVIGACYALVCRRIWCRKIPGNELAQQPESQNTNSQQSSEQQQTHPGNHKVHHHYRGGQQPQQRTFVLHRARLRALRMLLAVVAAFALAWLPLYLTFTRLKFATSMSEEESEFWKVVIPIAQWLGSANSCVNPVLYHFLDPRFRAGFRQLLCNSSTGNGRQYQTRQSPSHQLANGINQPNVAIGTAGAQQLLQSSNGRLRPPIQITFQQPAVRGDHNSRADGTSGSSGSSSNNNKRRQPFQEMELMSVNNGNAAHKNLLTQSGSTSNINNVGRHNHNHHSGHYYCRSTQFPRQNEEWI